MGGSSSLELNITMMSSILQCNLEEIENVLLHIEGRPKNKSRLELFYNERMRRNAQRAAQAKMDLEELLKKQSEEEAAQLAAEADDKLARENGEDTVLQQVVNKSEGLIAAANVSTPQKSTRNSNNHNNNNENTNKEQTIERDMSSPFAIGKEELHSFQRVVEEVKLDPLMYVMSPEDFQEILLELNFSLSDIDILLQLYTLIDVRGFDSIDIRVVLISFSLLLAKDAKEFIIVAFQLFDRVKCDLIEKKDLLDIFTLANDTLQYFGDKNLKHIQVVDLVDSIFTSAGKIDGEIYYIDYIGTMTEHPIIEMLLSPQFQGNIRSKLIDEATRAGIDLAAAARHK